MLRIRFYTAMKKAAESIHLVDLCLLLFLVVLLVQSACSLFLPKDTAGESGSIDIIVRTSSAAIFGYFLSANFNRRTPASTDEAVSTKQKNLCAASSSKGPLAQIGFQDPDSQTEQPLDRMAPASIQTEDTQSAQNRLQIITATCIGLFSLFILVLLRWIGLPEDGSATATVAQFRDFVSGCVGFLIGCPTCKFNPSQS